MAKKNAAPAAESTPATEGQAAAPAPAAPAKPAKIEQNGVTRPAAGTATGKVWDITDSLSAAKKAPAARGEVIKACTEAGLNASTAATQYGKWRKFHGLKGSDEAKTPAAAPAAPAPADATVG